ncbi:LacI family transcriptional regulator [Actinoplanes bogorensis]|uniref:LacI family transcriptional regulator n=1 Tax=Paractinoplanes bogorensis TaxID=1610840 RepID=A0ABS5YLC3_9ACTN|nr:LacI family DNA-binding transcriptional regulator [Actinoplanes bogorensis]MBU2663529.1 LacI family transcriptional regulator [Actinoplanes bogorensis]
MSKAKPTIKDVADRAGVSRSAVSRVMNNEPGASPPVRERVRRAMAELGHVPDQTARALASGRQRAVDVVAVTHGPAIGWLGSHPYYSRVLAGVTDALQGTDVQVRIQVIARPDDLDAADAIATRASVGMVLTDVPAAMTLRLQQQCRRVVSLSATSSLVASIDADNTGGAYAAVEYLHSLGRRHIAEIYGPEQSADARQRRAGYRQATQALNLPTLADGGNFRREDGYAAAQRLLEKHPEIDAMFVSCDLMAAGAVQAITASGRRVPYDVSVVGFDDSIAAVCANPPLTTMRMPVEQMAAAATRLLLDGDVPPSYRQCLPVTLVPRESTARRPSA